MSGWIWLLIAIYGIGFAVTVHYHSVLAPNATATLVLARCLIWPVFWATGWPHGTPLPMD